MPEISTPLAVRDLRRRRKPYKEALVAAIEHNPTAMRFSSGHAATRFPRTTQNET